MPFICPRPHPTPRRGGGAGGGEEGKQGAQQGAQSGHGNRQATVGASRGMDEQHSGGVSHRIQAHGSQAPKQPQTMAFACDCSSAKLHDPYFIIITSNPLTA